MRLLGLAAVVLLGVPSFARAAEVITHCRSAGLSFGDVGRTILQHYDDGHGHQVELWCVKGVFNAHYDLRIVEADRLVPGGRRSKTIAGCFFNYGTNRGPDLSYDGTGAFSAISWSNEAPPPERVAYRFNYEYRTGMVTISAETPCHPPSIVRVAPQDSFEKMEDLLPPAPSGVCPSRS